MRGSIALLLLLALPISSSLPAQEPHLPVSGEGEKQQEKHPPNGLAGEQSPYLLQHAHNPVNWQPWGAAAFATAKKLDRPVFLSSGYAACHWCHVMERESFENAEIAAILNRAFVCIKIDREERPDVDRIYMNYCTLRTGRGGWPLSVFLTPDKKPFFAGTYFPPEDQGGYPGFKSIVTQIEKDWKTQRKEIDEAAGKITEHLASLSRRKPASSLPAELSLRAAAVLESTEDEALGGFGRAPKFPMPSTLLFLLRSSARHGDPDAGAAVARQLDAMRKGGIRDHLAGGFHRYSVDAKWLVPHFEKMLYDQALMARVYVEAAALREEPVYAAMARETLDFCLDTLLTEDGGFIAALDADTMGVEGLTYTFTHREIDLLLKGAARDALKAWSAISEEGNWEHGRNIIHEAVPVSVVAEKLGKSEVEVQKALAEARRILLMARNARPQPRRDIKVISGWNALMISALARASTALDAPRYLEAALRTAGLIETHLLDKELVLLRSWAGGKARHPAELFDHAAVIAAWLDLHEATLDRVWLEKASRLAEATLKRFANEEGHLVDSVASDLVVRTASLFDGAIPSGTSLMALACVRLGQLRGEPAWTTRGETALRHGVESYQSSLTASPHAMIALDLLTLPAVRVELEGDPAKLAPLRATLRKRYRPFIAVTHRASEEGPRALVCVGQTCLEPAKTPEELEARIAEALK